MNPNSKEVLTAYLEPSIAHVQAEQRIQFERHGYFVADRIDHSSSHPVFNFCVGLKDNWK